MTRLALPDMDALPPDTRRSLENMGAPLGQIGNFSRLLAQDPALLDAVSSLQATLTQQFDAQTWSRIALTVSTVNSCDYSLSSYGFMARFAAKLDEDEIDLAYEGRARDVREAEIVRFARNVAEYRGAIPDADLARLRKVGVSDVQILRLVSAVAFVTLTNLVNNVALTEIDFPRATATATAQRG